jgi:cyanate permease
MEKKGIYYALFILVIMLLAYLIPYTVLSHVDAWYGSFLFWTVFALVAIVANVFISVSWRD